MIRLLVFCFLFVCSHCYGQSVVCNKRTIFNFTFGSATTPGMNLSFLANYRESSNRCPEDGTYRFTSSTSDCFYGNWIAVPQDHTPGDVNGNMMLVNSSPQPGEFFLVKVRGLKPTTIYELSAWITNVCQRTVNCHTLYPSIDFVVKGTDGRQIARFSTGRIMQSSEVAWKRYSAQFSTPAVVGDVVISLVNMEEGGCGNDFAIDDVLLTSCETIPPPQPVAVEPKSPVAVVTKPRVKENPSPVRVIKPDTVQARKNPAPGITSPELKPVVEPVKVKPAPPVIKERNNPLVKEILTAPTELLVELYDNGVVDGDTVSVYHNNELVISKAGLSGRPLSLNIRCDADNPYHELIMVAHNLGSIPPNTSLMIVTAGERRYEAFISSDNRKNAKVIIRLRE